MRTAEQLQQALKGQVPPNLVSVFSEMLDIITYYERELRQEQTHSKRYFKVLDKIIVALQEEELLP